MNRLRIDPQPIINRFGRASQESIAEAVGVSRPTVSNWLTGRMLAIDLETLEKFVVACQVQPGAFFAWDECPPDQ